MKIKGYTLLELIIVLSIFALFIAMATADFNSVYHHIKTKKLVGQIVQEIYLTRSLAISQQQERLYCSSDGNWSDTRLIKSMGGGVLRQFAPLPKPYQLILKNSLHKNNQITFLPLGFTQEERCSFYLSSPTEVIRIIVGVSGNARIITCDD